MRNRPDFRNEIGKINLALLLQAFFQMHRRDGFHDFVHPFRRREGRIHGDQFAVDAEDDRRADFQVHVRGAALNGGFENFIEQFHAHSIPDFRMNASRE